MSVFCHFFAMIFKRDELKSWSGDPFPLDRQYAVGFSVTHVYVDVQFVRPVTSIHKLFIHHFVAHDSISWMVFSDF